jgi:hypothetical protein
VFRVEPAAIAEFDRHQVLTRNALSAVLNVRASVRRGCNPRCELEMHRAELAGILEGRYRFEIAPPKFGPYLVGYVLVVEVFLPVLR